MVCGTGHPTSGGGFALEGRQPHSRPNAAGCLSRDGFRIGTNSSDDRENVLIMTFICVELFRRFGNGCLSSNPARGASPVSNRFFDLAHNLSGKHNTDPPTPGPLAPHSPSMERTRANQVEKQAKRYDAEGAYVRHWLPELAALPTTALQVQ